MKNYTLKKTYFFISAIFCIILFLYLTAFNLFYQTDVVYRLINGTWIEKYITQDAMMFPFCCCYIFLPLNAIIYAFAYRKEISLLPKMFMFITSLITFLSIPISEKRFSAEFAGNSLVLFNIAQSAFAVLLIASLVFAIISMVKYPKKEA